MSSNKKKSQQVDQVTLERYKNSNVGIHVEVNELVNNINATRNNLSEDIVGDRCTVIISVPKKVGGSFGDHPGHCGVVLWNSGTLDYQSFGILSDGTFADEEVNVNHDQLKSDENFIIWYFTVMINDSTYEKLINRMATLGSKKVTYGKFFVARGWKEDGSYSCVTAVDTILCAGKLSKGIASMTSTPYAYAQTFTRAGWYISQADNMKHM